MIGREEIKLRRFESRNGGAGSLTNSVGLFFLLHLQIIS